MRTPPGPEAPIEALHVLVRGLVQGVSFRYHAGIAARSKGVVGWVRNLPDGRVEAHVQGPPEAVADMLAWLRHGPSAASVEGIESAPTTRDETLRSFDTRR